MDPQTLVPTILLLAQLIAQSMRIYLRALDGIKVSILDDCITIMMLQIAWYIAIVT
jgi:hypothetical protein